MTYTHGHDPSVLESHRNRTIANSAAYAEEYFVPGADVLDIGSGPGTITAEIAQRVAPGQVVAVEITDAAAAVTSAELSRQQVTNARVVTGDVHNLELPDESFDVVHAHQVLQHVSDPIGALREMGRVCRSGGVIAVRDSDYGRFEWGRTAVNWTSGCDCIPRPRAPMGASPMRAGIWKRGRVQPDLATRLRTGVH